MTTEKEIIEEVLKDRCNHAMFNLDKAECLFCEKCVEKMLEKALQSQKQKIIEKIKKWKFNKNGSFDKKTKESYERVSYKLFIKKLLKSFRRKR